MSAKAAECITPRKHQSFFYSLAQRGGDEAPALFRRFADGSQRALASEVPISRVEAAMSCN
eukprot:9757218-Alexandrium_andersonii.AAC.1